MVDGVYMFGFVALPAHPFFLEFDIDKRGKNRLNLRLAERPVLDQTV